MADEVQSVGLDASDFTEGIKEIAAALKKYDIAVEDAVDATAKFNRQGELVSATVKRIEADGTKVAQTFGLIKNRVVEVTDGMGGMIRRFQDLNGQLTNNPLSFGLQRTSVASGSDLDANEINKIKENLRIKEQERTQRARIYNQMIADQKAFQVEKDATQAREQQAEQTRIRAMLAAKEQEKTERARIYQAMRRDEDQRLRDIVALTNAELAQQQKKAPSAAGGGLAAIGNRATSILLSQAIIQTTQALQESVSAANEFSKQLAAIQTISQKSGVSTNEFADGIIRVSNAFGLARKDVAEGVYETISNQVAEGTSAIQFQVEAAKLAQATLSSQADSVNALSSVLNSYNLNVSETNKISGAFFKTIDLGRLRLGDLSNTIGTVTVAANQLGVSYQEVFASIAELTRQGVTAANAQTFLRNLLNQLIKPTEATKEALDKYGFSTGQAAIQTLGFQGVLKLLAKEADGNVEKFGEFGTNIRSLQALLGLAGDGGTKLDATIKEITKSTEEYGNATKIVQESTGKQFDVITTTIQNSFLKIGQTLQKGVVDVTNAFGGIQNVLNTSGNIIKASVVGLAAFFAKDLVTATQRGVLAVRLAVFQINKELALLKVSELSSFTRAFSSIAGLQIGATAFFGGIATALAGLSLAVQKFQDDIQEAQDAIRETENETVNVIRRGNQITLDEIAKTQNESLSIVSAAIAEQITKYNELGAKATEVFNKERDRTAALFEDIVSSQKKTIRDLVNENNRSQREIETSVRETEQLRIRLREDAFEIAVKDSTLQLQTLQRVQQREELLGEARAQAAAGNREGAKTALDLAEKQNQKLAQLRDQVRQYASEFNQFIENTAKETFTNQSRVIDLTTTQINKTLDRLKKSLKDVNDKTGDRTGISGAFLKTFTKELDIAAARTDAGAERLRRNLNRLQNRGRVGILDEQTQELLNSLDSQTVRELRFRIRINDTEGTASILDEIKRQQEEQAKVQKQRIADQNSLFLLDQAQAARKRNDFDTERRFLQEAKELRLQAIEDPLELQRTFSQFNSLIAKSYQDQLTTVGKKKEQEDSIFQKTIDGLNAQIDTNKILREQLVIQNELKQAEQEKIQQRNQTLDVLKNNLVEFQTAIKQLNDIKIDARTTPEEAAKLFETRAKQLDEALRNVASSPDDIIAAEETKARIKEQLARQTAAAELSLGIETQTKLLEETQRSEVLKRDIRLALLRAVQDQVAKTSEGLANLRTRLAQGESVTDQIVPLEFKLKDDRALARAIRESLEQGSSQLTPDLEAQLVPFFNKLSVSGLTDVIREQLDFTEIFEQDAASVDGLKLKLDDAAREIERPKTFNIVIDEAATQLDILLEKKKQLEAPVKIMIQNPEGEEIPGFATGGVVGGIPGRDKNLARLTKDEFVVNSVASRKFRSELIQINSGATPSTVTKNNNVNLNGININLSSTGNASVDARQIADELSRLVKRGIVRLS